MTLKQQVISLEISKRLKELGVKQESYFMWAPDKKGYGMEIRIKRKISFERSEFVYSAYTVAELGEILPVRNIVEHSHKIKQATGDEMIWHACVKGDNEPIGEEIFASTEADARGKMLIYLLENNLINLADINK